jgi:hypothetical protein
MHQVICSKDRNREQRYISMKKQKDSVELDIEGVNGADPNKDVSLVNPAFSAVPGSDLIVARSSKYHYKGYGFEWNNSGKNGFYCKFSYSS